MLICMFPLTIKMLAGPCLFMLLEYNLSTTKSKMPQAFTHEGCGIVVNHLEYDIRIALTSRISD
jgi:hypothetical protein